jgi:hypothetical protein
MVGFSIVWAGQLISVLASNMSWFALTIVVIAWFIPTIRNVEELLPDHDQLEKAEEVVRSGECGARSDQLDP